MLYIFIRYTFIDNEGGIALAGALGLFEVFWSFPIILIEQFILKKIKSQKYYFRAILFIEFLIIIGVCLYFYNKNTPVFIFSNLFLS